MGQVGWVGPKASSWIPRAVKEPGAPFPAGPDAEARDGFRAGGSHDQHAGLGRVISPAYIFFIIMIYNPAYRMKAG